MLCTRIHATAIDRTVDNATAPAPMTPANVARSTSFRELSVTGSIAAARTTSRSPSRITSSMSAQ